MYKIYFDKKNEYLISYILCFIDKATWIIFFVKIFLLYDIIIKFFLFISYRKLAYSTQL